MTGSELQRAVQFANPVSGEVLTLDAPSEDLGRYLADLREYESVLREHKRMVNRELLARLDKAVSWTQHLPGGLKLSAPSSEPVEEWDGAILREALLEFVDRDEIAIEAVDAAVEIVIEHKVKKAGVKALRKRGGDIKSVIDLLAREIERDRYVKVELS